jgi:hypothetical protein
MSKKGYSTGFSWVFALVSLFGIGVMYIVFNQVFVANLVPTIKNMANNSAISNIDQATVSDIYGNIDKYMTFFQTMPFILFFVIVVYMIIAAIRSESQDQQL